MDLVFFSVSARTRKDTAPWLTPSYTICQVFEMVSCVGTGDREGRRHNAVNE